MSGRTNHVFTCTNNIDKTVFVQSRKSSFTFLKHLFFRPSHLLPSVFGTASLNFGIHLPKTDLSRCSELSRASQLQISDAKSQSADFGAKSHRPRKPSATRKKTFLWLSCHLTYKIFNINITFKILHWWNKRTNYLIRFWHCNAKQCFPHSPYQHLTFRYASILVSAAVFQFSSYFWVLYWAGDLDGISYK